MQTDKTFQVRISQQQGNFSRLVAAIASTGVSFGNISTRHVGRAYIYRDITVEFQNDEQFQLTLEAIRAVPGIILDAVVDEVMKRHEGGKLQYRGRVEVRSLDQLREIYTPGVAKVCMAIKEEPALARKYTTAGNTVAVISNGTRVLGMGAIGPLAALPVMESKALFYSQFVGLNGVALVLNADTVESFVETVVRVAPNFAGIHLEDIRTPDCFAIEEALIERLTIPVMHDDQHGTAVVALSATINMLKTAKRALEETVVAQVGLGAAGIAIGKLLKAAGVRRIIGVDPNAGAQEYARHFGLEIGPMEDALKAADVVILTTGRPGLISPAQVRKGQMILALSNPQPEIEPREALAAGASFAMDGRNVNNVLCYPGLFRGAIDAGAKSVSIAMKLAAARVISDAAPEGEILPDALDPTLHTRVTAAVREAAECEAAAIVHRT